MVQYEDYTNLQILTDHGRVSFKRLMLRDAPSECVQFFPGEKAIGVQFADANPPEEKRPPFRIHTWQICNRDQIVCMLRVITNFLNSRLDNNAYTVTGMVEANAFGVPYMYFEVFKDNTPAQNVELHMAYTKYTFGFPRTYDWMSIRRYATAPVDCQRSWQSPHEYSQLKAIHSWLRDSLTWMDEDSDQYHLLETGGEYHDHVITALNISEQGDMTTKELLRGTYTKPTYEKESSQDEQVQESPE